MIDTMMTFDKRINETYGPNHGLSGSEMSIAREAWDAAHEQCALICNRAEDNADVVSRALRIAWHLGQTYWQQADSEYTSQHRKADETQGKFFALVDETRNKILSLSANPPEQAPHKPQPAP
jgi:hypothetical protein